MYSWPGVRPGSSVWNGLYYTIRRPPCSTAKLADVDYSVDFTKVTTPSDRVAVIATIPLTVNEEWTEFKRGWLLMFDNVLPYLELYDCQEVEQQGRGLFSRVLERPNREAVLASLRYANVAFDIWWIPSNLRQAFGAKQHEGTMALPTECTSWTCQLSMDTSMPSLRCSMTSDCTSFIVATRYLLYFVDHSNI